LQHPLGVAVLDDGSIAIADTYNGAIRRYDPVTDEVSTLARDLDEPSGLVVIDDELIVVESGAHQLVRRPVAISEGVAPAAVAMTASRPVTDLAPGSVELEVVFNVAAGRKLDADNGPSTRLSVTASPPELLLAGGGEFTTLRTTLTLAAGPSTGGVLNVTAQAATCDDPADDVEAPACYLSRQDWGVPIRVVAGGSTRLELMLLG
jgi:hypothetical protein